MTPTPPNAPDELYRVLDEDELFATAPVNDPGTAPRVARPVSLPHLGRTGRDRGAFFAPTTVMAPSMRLRRGLVLALVPVAAVAALVVLRSAPRSASRGRREVSLGRPSLRPRPIPREGPRSRARAGTSAPAALGDAASGRVRSAPSPANQGGAVRVVPSEASAEFGFER